mgnify:CR=1 FL=1
MPVTITFNKTSEKKPENQESIIWLRTTSSFGYQGFEPREVDVEYQWTELDEDGYETGNSYTFESNEDFSNNEKMRLDLLFDGYIAAPNDLWVSQEDFWKCFE